MAYLTGRTEVFTGDTTVVDSAAMHPVGTRAFDKDGNEYIYLLGVASVAIGTWVSFDEAGVTTRSAANAKGRVGVAMAAIVASSYGWFQIYGEASGLALTAFADNGLVFLTGTAGSVDDTAVAGDLVVGAMGRSAVNETTLLATFELNYPFVTDNLGS